MNHDTPKTLTESDVFALLAHRQRRLILRLLQDVSPPLTTHEIATLIAEGTYEEPPADRLQSIYLSIRHRHLPMLEERNVVTYCEDAGTIAPGSNYGTLLGALEANDRIASPPQP